MQLPAQRIKLLLKSRCIDGELFRKTEHLKVVHDFILVARLARFQKAPDHAHSFGHHRFLSAET